MPGSDRLEATDRLLSIPLFQNVPAVTLKRLANTAGERRAVRRTCFFVEGTEVSEFMVLTSGRVKLSMHTADGSRFALGLVSPNEPFGAVGATPDHRHSTTAEVLQNATALVWAIGTIRQAFEDDSRLAMNALDMQSVRLDSLHVRFGQFATEPVQCRVARAVLRLPQIGRFGKEIIEVECLISRQEIAEMSGTTLFAVSRLLCAWERRGIVRLGRERVIVDNHAALAAIADRRKR